MFKQGCAILKYTLKQLVDFNQFKNLMDSYSMLTGISLAILDVEGNRQALSAPCKICEEYHRKHNGCLKQCKESDHVLIETVKRTNKSLYRVCKNGIVDMASPICLNGEHLAVIFAGQFLMDEPDLNFFKKQAEKYGFDTDKYLEEVRKLPVMQEDKIQAISDFITKLADMMVNTGYKQIQQLIQKEEIHKLEVKAVEAQLNLLQSQINPHFIHNTLNTVSYLALKHNAKDIKDLITSFNILLRSSMSIDTVFISIEEELECVKSYLNIQKYRYDDIFDFQYEVPDELKTCKIPKLILQPLIENSLLHGIIPKEQRGLISVAFEKMEQDIKVTVCDNGIGMDEDLTNLINKRNKKYKEGFNNIGLTNVIKRLHLYFGQEYPFDIKSTLNKGTVVTFYIPLNYEEELTACIK